MKIAVFSTKSYDRDFLGKAFADSGHVVDFFDFALNAQTAPLARGFEGVCVFVNDQVGKDTLEILAECGVGIVTLRCAGFNNVDVRAAQQLGIVVTRVPAYSPQSVAEHTLALYLALNRRIVRAHNRVRESNFSLEGLLGFDTAGKTLGLIGTGKIGAATARVFSGLGCRILAYDIRENPKCQALGAQYVSLESLFERSDIISLHCPLNKHTHHIINTKTLAKMKDGVFIVNTSRGGLIDSRAIIDGLKSGKVGNLAMDVYEEEEALFFEDRSTSVLQDDVFARLVTFPNVLITGHQAFFTRNALEQIAATTLTNIQQFADRGRCENAVDVTD